MKIEFQNAGYEGRLIITGYLPESRKLNVVVDEILLRIPGLRVVEEGFFLRTIIITGKYAALLHAEAGLREIGFKVREREYNE
ncbi:hypothetical protein EOY42_26380 [Salmonella enterica]|nr:hypothetical protein [Salmonella enterica]EBD7602518.1 hypothetical protein [Salmonella enterica]